MATNHGEEMETDIHSLDKKTESVAKRISSDLQARISEYFTYPMYILFYIFHANICFKSKM